MKQRLLILLFTGGGLLHNLVSVGQDIPLFSQKLTNSFIYNPAMAGHTFGSVTYSYRKNYSGVTGAPENHFLSLHTPLLNYRFGIGANVYQEDVNFLRNLYSSVAFAYHIHFTKLSILSMGVSGEYNSISLNGKSNFITDDPELALLSKGTKDFDFSFGLNYQNPYIKVGVAANRLATAWLRNDNEAVLSSYYSGYIQGMIPLRSGEDLLEPYVAFRKFSETNDTYDVGLYYTYNNKITVGAAMRRGSVFDGTLGFRFSRYLMLGYSREMILNNIGGFVGAANELTLRFDFNSQEYQEKFRADYKSAVSYRRKTLTTSFKRPGGNNPKKLHRAQKKLAPYSPNKRYQNIKKLSGNKKTARKKFNIRKRQRNNHKRKAHGRK